MQLCRSFVRYFVISLLSYSLVFLPSFRYVVRSSFISLLLSCVMSSIPVVVYLCFSSVCLSLFLYTSIIYVFRSFVSDLCIDVCLYLFRSWFRYLFRYLFLPFVLPFWFPFVLYLIHYFVHSLFIS